MGEWAPGQEEKEGVISGEQEGGLGLILWGTVEGKLP